MNSYIRMESVSWMILPEWLKRGLTLKLIMPKHFSSSMRSGKATLKGNLLNHELYLFIDRSVPAGSVKTAWTEILNESSVLSEQHNNVKDRLISEVLKMKGSYIFCQIYNHINKYRKENTHSTFRGLKETRDMEADFEKVVAIFPVRQSV